MKRGIRTGLVLMVVIGMIQQSAQAAPRKGAGVPVDGVRFIDSRHVEINFQLGKKSQACDKASLYVTRDKGVTWTLWNGPTSAKPPISYEAPDDGLYGFYIILENKAGASSGPPEKGTAPQQWVRIDTKVPDVQLLALRADAEFEKNREVRIRWRADDENLTDRPVSVHYRTEESKVFMPIVEAQPGLGELRWTVPPQTQGRVEIKISAQDLAGKVTEYKCDRLRIDGAIAEVRGVSGDSALAVKQPGTPAAPKTLQTGYHEPDASGRAVSAEAVAEAKKSFDQGTYHRIRGEYDLAAIRYEEATKLDPDYLEAWHDLAGIHLLAGRYPEARRIFSLILDKDPHYRPAMKGLALVQTSEKNYKSARQTLERLLLLTPLDAEAWLYYGDVVMFSGDRVAARDAWGKASTLEKADADIRRRASKRLDLYPGTEVALTGEEP